MTAAGPSQPDVVSLAAESLELLRRRGETVATAESLTAGLIVATMTRVAGASDVVRGGLAAYATDVKRDVLGVDAAVIAAYGVVSAQTAKAMAKEAVRLFDSDWAVAATGVAGPDEQDGQPVGRVYVAVGGPAARFGEPRGAHIRAELAVEVAEHTFTGDRGEIRSQTVSVAIELLRKRVTAAGGSGRSTTASSF